MRTAYSSILMVLIVGLLWGLNWTAVKFMMSELPPYSIRAIAFPFAALLLASIATLQGHRLWPSRGEWVPLCFTSAFLIFGFNILTSLGQSLTEASNAAIIAYTMPVMTAILSALHLGERIGKNTVFALLLGMTGLTVLITHDLGTLLDNPAGAVVMLLAALTWSIGNVALKAHQWTLSTTMIAAWSFAVAILPCWLLVWVTENPAALAWPSTPVVLTMVFHILGPMVICYQLWAILLERLPAAIAAISVLTAPVVGVLSAALFLGETLNASKLVALLLVVASIFVTLRKKS